MSLRLVLYKAINKYHTFAGIFISINLVILLCSGLTLIFAEIQHTHNYIAEAGLDQNTFANKYNQVNSRLHELYPNDRPLDIYPDENNPHIIHARLGMNGSNVVSGSRNISFDYQSGQEIQAAKLPASEFYNFMLSLHEELFMGQRGQIYIGCVGIAFILMNLTGLMKFLRKRRTSLHQYLGVFCLSWGLIVGVTGTLLALNPIFTKHFQEHTLKPLAEKHQLEINKPDVELKAIIDAAFKIKPDGVIWYIVYPGMERGIQNHYLVLIHGNGIISQYLSEYLLIDAKTAKLKEIIHLPILMQLVFIATPLHAVNYGGIILKMIWVMFAIGTLCLALLGMRGLYLRIKKRCHSRGGGNLYKWIPASAGMTHRTHKLKKLAELHSLTCFLNALLREWHEYVIYQSSSKLYVQISLDHTKLIEIPVLRYSILGRHEYAGEIYLKSNEQIAEISFKTFADYMCDKFAENLNINVEKFKFNVLSSCENIHKTLNASRIPATNADFIAAEQALMIGHNFHPTPKSRDNFTDQELQNYAPEFKGEFQLKWLLVDPAITQQKFADSFEHTDWLRQLFSEDNAQGGADMLPIPMHPWQWNYLQQNPVIAEYIQNGQIIPVDQPTKQWSATSSLRTVYRDDCAYMLKFSMNLKLTNSLRVLLNSEVARGLLLHDVLSTNTGKKFLQEFPDFHIMTEPASICIVDTAGMPIESTIVVCRHNPFNGDDVKNKYMLATLIQDDPFGGTNLLLELIRNSSSNLSIHSRLKKWFADYLRVTIKPLIIAYANYGIIMEGHQQNIVLALKDGFPAAAYFRDCQDHAYSELGYQLFADDIKGIKARSNCIANKEIGCHYFIYQVMLNSTLNVITTLAKSGHIHESELLGDLREFLKDINKLNIHDSYCLDKLLNSPALLHKCNFKFALTQINDNEIPFNPLELYTEVPNLISANISSHHPDVLYHRYFKSISKTITLRSLNLATDLKQFIAWQQKSRIAKYWDLDKPQHEVKVYLEQIVADPYQQPVVIEINHEPAGYCELYWAAKDNIAKHYDYQDYDRGFHLLMGEDHLLGVANTTAVFQAIMHFLYLENNQTARIIVEPDVNNQNFIKYTTIIPGWQFIKASKLPEKKAAIFMSQREDFMLEGV